LASAQRSGR